MKLLIIGPYPVRNNGMSEYIAHYRNELIAQGHEVHTACLYFWRNKFSALKWFAFRRFLTQSFDAILIQHTPTASGPFIASFLRAAKKAYVPVVVIAHETPSIYAKHLPKALRSFYLSYECQVFELAAGRIVHTGIHAQELRKCGVQSPIQVIPIPVYGLPAATSAKEARLSWGYYGMISRKKGIDLLLQAYQMRPAGHYPPLRLIGGAAPGEESYTQSLAQLINTTHAPHIHFAGFVESEKIPQAFADIGLMIFPYRWVSQSAALAQTCQQRIPYLASDLPYFNEFHQRYGCGTLFKTESTDALSTALDSALLTPPGGANPPFDALLESLSLKHGVKQLLEVVSHATPSR